MNISSHFPSFASHYSFDYIFRVVRKLENRDLCEPHRKYSRKDMKRKLYSHEVSFQPAEANIPALVRWTGHLIEKKYGCDFFFK